MTPKEKAKELVYIFYDEIKYIDRVKKCALIAVNYIINANPHSNLFNTNVFSTMDYWLEVKQEIENL